MTYLMDNGKIEPKSATKTSWSAIHEKAPYSKKKIKSGAFRSVYFRHPEEKPRFSAKTLERKAASAAKIENMRRAATKYRLMVEEPAAKVDKFGRVVVQKRQKGKFLPLQILLNAQS